MRGPRVLFIGGTGIISSACASRAIEAGIELSLLNRGLSSVRPLPAGAELIRADVRDRAAVERALGQRSFDVVVDFVAFDPEHVRQDVELFRGRVGQYVFISSASAYAKPVARLPIVESTPLRNPYWDYSRAKIACEDLLVRAYREEGFPATIVRPSHTYDRASIPFHLGWTIVERMRQGRPVVVHGDGTSLWVLTHHSDFAKAFVALLGNPQAIGDSFHITSDEVLSWNQIYEIMGRAAGAEPRLVHVSSETIARIIPRLRQPLLGDAAHSVVFDNSKVRQLAPGYVATVPFAQGAQQILEWRDEDPSRRQVDPDIDTALDALVAAAG